MNTITRFPSAQARINEIELCGWLSQASPGEAIEYHRGFLVVDRTSIGQPMTATDRRELDRTGKRAMRLAERGLVHLVQRRHGPDDYSYLAVACLRPKHTPESLSSFLLKEVT
jgi:hypothetical protein